MLDFKKSTFMYEFSLYPVITITKLQKLHMLVHDQQKPTGNHVCPHEVLEAGRLGRCSLTKTSLVTVDR